MATTENPRILHLYVDVDKQHAFQIKQVIEAQFGKVETCYLTDSWYEDSEKRTIYYQRLLNPSREGLEPWEESDAISEEKLEQGIQAVKSDTRSGYLRYRINDSITYEA